MSLSSKLRDFLHGSAMRKFKGTHLQQAPPDLFGQVRKIGILFDANEAADREAVLAYADKLRKTGINVWLFGFFNAKIESVTFPFDFFDLTAVSFARLPKGEKINRFIETQFDVLINLDHVLYPPLNYAAAASRALFKIGPALGDPRHYDLMVQSESNTLAGYIEDIRKVFNKIAG